MHVKGKSLADIIRDAIQELRADGGPETPARIAQHILASHRDEMEPHFDRLLFNGLYQECRETVKRRPSDDGEDLDPRQLSLDLGLLACLAHKYAVPDPGNQNEKGQWIATGSLTIPEAKRAAAALRDQIAADSAQLKVLQQAIAAAEQILGPDSELTLGDAGRLAREQRSQKAGAEG